MADDGKAPSEQAKKQRDVLTGKMLGDGGTFPLHEATRIAFALYIDTVDKVATWAVKAGYDTPEMRSLMLPDEFDPLEEVIREAGKLSLTPTAEWFRAELAKRNGRIVFEEEE